VVRIASYNVENLFSRPKAFDTTDWSVGEPILAAYHEVNALMNKSVYSPADKQTIRNLLARLDIYRPNSSGALRRVQTQSPRWAWLRKNRGDFDRQPASTSQDIEIIASGRGDWIGWVELAKEATNEIGTRMTAKVIAEIGADIIGIVEAEDRPSLVRFNSELLGGQYGHAMLVDGNDERGIDVGLMTRSGFEIKSIRSNVDTRDNVGIVFSRDCAEYQLMTPGGTTLHVLLNHFKSQSGGGGSQRKRQAAEVRRIVNRLVAQDRHVVVMGDLNEGPAAAGSHAPNLSDLFSNGSPLVDCYSLTGFQAGNRPGTFDSCAIRERLDYIFVSQSLLTTVTGGGVFRKGLWGTRVTRPDKWDTYPEMTNSKEQASDHAAVFIDLNV
jgi:endonuclease/exonuclease/phosphatase family metal-dependent hydrolase